jgi:hypothetical protein
MAKKAQLPKTPPPGSKPSTKTASKDNTRWLILGLIGAVVVLAVGLILLNAQSNRQPVATTARVGEGTAWGPADAPIVITDFSDFL